MSIIAYKYTGDSSFSKYKPFTFSSSSQHFSSEFSDRTEAQESKLSWLAVEFRLLQAATKLTRETLPSTSRLLAL